MPSTSPGTHTSPTTSTSFTQVLPGAPTTSLQTTTCFSFRHKSHVAYISGRYLHILSGPNTLAQSLSFNEDLVAVRAEAHSCKIAVAGAREVWVLEPVTEGWRRCWWEKVLFLRRDDAEDETRCLSWGVEGELLIGGTKKLSFFSTIPSSHTSAAADSPSDQDREVIEERRALWSIPLPSPVQRATFSHSGAMIASYGDHDRIVKIWRRLSFEEGLFDYFYLRHEATVTHLQWRPIDEHSEEDGDRTSDSRGSYGDEEPEALYTIGSDGLLRVWKTGAPHDIEMLVLHTTIDLVSGIPKRPSLDRTDSNISIKSSNRYTCILHSSRFHTAVNASIQRRNSLQRRSSQHLIEVSTKQPDIIMSFDGRGRMSAWGMQSIAHKRRRPSTPTSSETFKAPYSITRTDNIPIRIPDGVNARCRAWFEGDVFNLVEHRFDGAIRWWKGEVEDVFGPPGSDSERLAEVGYWGGHSTGPIEVLRAGSVDGGRGLVSCSSGSSGGGEIVNWRSTQVDGGGLSDVSRYEVEKRVLDAATLVDRRASRQYTVTLELDISKGHQSSIDLVLRDSTGAELTTTLGNADDEGEKRWQLFASNTSKDSRHHVIALNSALGGGYACVINTSIPDFEQRKEFTLPLPATDDDPVKHVTAVSDASETDKFGIIGVTKSGVLTLWHLQPSSAGGAWDALVVGTFETGFADCSALVSNNEFAAIVASNSIEVGMINLVDGYVEYRHKATERIRYVVPAPRDSLLAIAFERSVDVLAQGRIGYREEMPPWVLIKRISVGDIGQLISSLVWLGDGSLALAAGNAIFTSSDEVAVEELDADVQEATNAAAASRKSLSMSALAQQLKSPIPIWHPTFVAHIVRHGSWSLAASLVDRLLQKLKFWTEGDALPPLLNVPAAQLYGAEPVHDEKTLDRASVEELQVLLEERDLPMISNSEQQRLKAVLETMLYCSEHVRGLDNGALRFLFSWRLELLLMQAKHPIHTNNETQRVNGTTTALKKVDPNAVPEMSWREVALAYHSTTQQPLLEILLAHYENKWTWDIARRLGVFAWLSDREALSQIFEALAQSTYRSTSPPDPINASLYFLVLGKKATLLGLWRIATWHKEQRATLNFLKRDFGDEKNQTAAKKNAYALMGKRRFEYAAAFFLLAGDGASATNILAGQCEDLMLAIAVGRLEGGDQSPALRKLIEGRLIPEGRRQGNRWLLSWCYSLLNDNEAAAGALVEPMGGVRHWVQDDPSTLALYKDLRTSTSEYEFDAVLRAARILRRMGLWLIALELVSQWNFKVPGGASTTRGTLQESNEVLTNGTQSSVLEDFARAAPNHGSTIDADINASTNDPVVDEKTAKAAELLQKIKAKKEAAAAAAENALNEKVQQPTQFVEPSANSLLDSFGF